MQPTVPVGLIEEASTVLYAAVVPPASDRLPRWVLALNRLLLERGLDQSELAVTAKLSKNQLSAILNARTLRDR